jgi:hypothetical protein
MPDDEATNTTEAQASGPVTQVGVALASLAEGWLRDVAMCGVVLLSLGVVLAGLSADDGVWIATGVVLGMAGAVTAVIPTIRHWRASRIWLTMLAVAAVDVALISFLAAR